MESCSNHRIFPNTELLLASLYFLALFLIPTKISMVWLGDGEDLLIMSQRALADGHSNLKHASIIIIEEGRATLASLVMALEALSGSTYHC